MGVSKVDYGDETLIDLTSDTVTPDALLSGVTAHSADGEEIVGNVITHNVIDNLVSTSSEDALSANQGRVLNEVLFKKNRPYFMFIDDDGRTAFNDIYTNVLYPRGIKAGLSICMSDALIGKTGYLTLDELKTYETNGNDILCHSTSINSIELSTADAVFRYCISQINKYGFNKNGIFVYPNGNTGTDKEAIEQIASNYFTYGININYNHNCPASIPIGNKQDIGRIFINPAGQNTDTVKSYYKNLIDDAFANNKLMIISTHSNSCEVAYLEEVLDYIIGKGGIFETPSRVFGELEKPAYEEKSKVSILSGESMTAGTELMQLVIDDMVHVIGHTFKMSDIYDYYSPTLKITLETVIDRIMRSIAINYDSLITYVPGSYCYRDRRLYKCLNTCVDTPPPDRDYWEEITLSSQLGGLRFGIDEDGNYGYYKVGADTLTPFKSGGSDVEYGTFTITNGSTYNIVLPFKPKQITCLPISPSGRFGGFVYDENISTSQILLMYGGGTNVSDAFTNIGTSPQYSLSVTSINNNVVTVYSRANSTNYKYIAIG